MADKRLKKETEGLEVDGKLLWIVASEVISKRLPAKSDIGSCRLVSRVWRSVLSTGKFNREYRKNHPVTIDEYKLAVFDADGEAFQTFSLGDEIPPPCRSLSPSPKVSFLASLDGLLVIAEERGASVTLMIFNPATPRAFELPRLRPDIYFFSEYDPLGFYFGADDDDYKLVRLSRYAAFSPYGAFVYSCRLGSWTPRQFSNDRLLDHPGEDLIAWSPPTSWGQRLYFALAFISDDGNWKGRSRIICFDVNTEKFSQTPFPHLQDDDASYFASLALVDGRLHLYVCLHDTDDQPLRVQVWKVKDDVDVVDLNWVEVGYVATPSVHHVCTKYAGNSVAVLDEGGNSFKKVDAKDFEARYPWLLHPTSEYGRSRVIYVPSVVDPCPAIVDSFVDSMCQDSFDWW